MAEISSAANESFMAAVQSDSEENVTGYRALSCFGKT